MPVLNVYVGSAKIALTLFGASKVEDERLIVRSAKLLVASSRSSCWILDDPLSSFLFRLVSQSPALVVDFHI